MTEDGSSWMLDALLHSCGTLRPRWGLAAGGAALAAGPAATAIYVRRRLAGSDADGQP